MRYFAFVAALAALGAQANPEPQTTLPAIVGASPVPFGPKPMGCSKFELLVARGTGEPGPYGVLTGDPLVMNVMKMVPGSRGYAVQYPADRTNMSVPTGVKDVVARLMQQDQACPDQKFALMGYSQGARVMHLAALQIPMAMQMNKIVALVMFGDPGLKQLSRGDQMGKFPMDMEMKLWENCAMGDPVCGQGTSFEPHLTYNDPGTPYQMDSAKFVAMAFMGTPLPAKTTGPDMAMPMATSMPNMPNMPNMPMPMPSMSMMPNMPNMPMPSMSMMPNMPGMSMSMSMMSSMTDMSGMPMSTMDPGMDMSGMNGMNGMNGANGMSGMDMGYGNSGSVLGFSFGSIFLAVTLSVLMAL